MKMNCLIILFLFTLLQWSVQSAASAPCPGYTASNIQTHSTGLTADLTLAGPRCDRYGHDITNLTLQVRFDSHSRLNVHIFDSCRRQYQIPPSILPLDQGAGVTKAASKLQLSYFHDVQHGFGFRVSRGKDTIFDTSGHPLIFEDQYIEVTSRLPHDANIYGIGETPDWFRRDTTNTTKTLWNRDAPDPFRENVYGSHSVYMELRNGKFHGTYLHNSHGMDIVLANSTIQYRVLGGTADFYFFSGPTALDVIDQYTRLVGRPNRIPYWALGFQNCRYGYKSVYEVNDVIANYSKARIPLEVAWTDIDYMDRTRDFTFDPVNFPLNEMQKQLEYLHAHNQKMVLMTDPAIQHNSSYGPYARGHEQDAFIKNSNGTTYFGQVWPGYTAFPDWFAPNTDKWWGGELQRYFDALPIDGMWLDMNEASSFCTGSCGSGKPESDVPPYPWTLDPPPPNRALDKRNRLLNPPYAIHNAQSELSEKTIETTAMHANGLADYYVHNLYGYMETRLTHKFLLQYRPDIRPFLLSRSTFAGSGAMANHWTGDNESTFKDLHISIASMLDFGIFGIPMVGADICGFNGNATEELCARWIEVGAFYPFSRDHNAKDMVPQELYRWPSVAEASRRALQVRYALLPYYYTNYQMAVEHGWPVARPLVFQFPETPAVLGNDRQFMIGDAILISPVLSKGARSVSAFFPSGFWYDWYDLSAVYGWDTEATLGAPLEHVNVHQRGGSIVVGQEPGLTTYESRRNPFFARIALDSSGCAEGRLYLDDGETFSSPHRWIRLSFSSGALSVVQESGSYTVGPVLATIVLLGARVAGVQGVQDGYQISHLGSSTIIKNLHIDLNSNTQITFISP